MTLIRLLEGVEFQKDGQKILTSPGKVNIRQGTTFDVDAPTPDEVRFTIPRGLIQKPVHVHGSDLGVEIYYCPYAITHVTSTIWAMVPNQLFAMLFRNDADHVIDKIWVRFNTSQTGSFRVGFYPNTGNTVVYPAAQLAGSDTLLSFVGQAGQVAAVNIALAANTWYWCVCNTTLSGNIITVHSTQLGYPIGNGFNAVGGPTFINGLKYAQAFGALPDPFPAGAGLLGSGDLSGQVPFIGVHYAS